MAPPPAPAARPAPSRWALISVPTSSRPVGTDGYSLAGSGYALYLSGNANIIVTTGTTTVNQIIGRTAGLNKIDSAVYGANLGALVLTNANTYTGSTTVANGILKLDFTALNSLRYSADVLGNDTMTLGGATTITSGGILETSGVGSRNVTIQGDCITSGNGQDLIVTQNNPQVAMTVGSIITDCGSTPIGLTKAGTGRVILAASNSYTGPTNILGPGGTVNAIGGSKGSLCVGKVNALPVGTDVIVNGGALQLGNYNQTVNSVMLDGNGGVYGDGNGGGMSSGVLTSANTYDVRSGARSGRRWSTAGRVRRATGSSRGR